MSECQEVAEAMLPHYRIWLRPYIMNTLDNARVFGRSRMAADESVTVIDNVAEALYRRVRGW
jgi:hypothetical protein